MAPRMASLPAPEGYSWNMFLGTYRKRNKDNYPRTRTGNRRLMVAAGKAWESFKEQVTFAFIDAKYNSSMDPEDSLKSPIAAESELKGH